MEILQKSNGDVSTHKATKTTSGNQAVNISRLDQKNKAVVANKGLHVRTASEANRLGSKYTHIQLITPATVKPI